MLGKKPSKVLLLWTVLCPPLIKLRRLHITLCLAQGLTPGLTLPAQCSTCPHGPTLHQVLTAWLPLALQAVLIHSSKAQKGLCAHDYALFIIFRYHLCFSCHGRGRLHSPTHSSLLSSLLKFVL